MHVCIYGVYYKHIYPACSLSHNDRKLFCLLSHAAASGPKWELLWIVGTLLVRSVCIFDWSLYTCAHKEWEYQNVNAANHKNTKYTLNIFIQKTEKQKIDKKKEKRRHWHRSSFGGFWRSAFFLSLPHPFSLSLCVSVSVCRLRQQMLIIKSKIFGIGLRTGTDREMVIAPRSHETIITSSRNLCLAEKQRKRERECVCSCVSATYARIEDWGSRINDRQSVILMHN